MDLRITGELAGSVAVPPSKSIAHRMLICAALADGPSILACGEYGYDVEVTANCLRDLGATIKYSDGTFRVWPIDKVEKRCRLDCTESGSTLRFLLPVSAALGADVTFCGSKSLERRPLSPLYEEMEKHGVTMSEQGVFPLSCLGQLNGGEYNIDAGISSQFISGLLMALPLVGESSTITLLGEKQSTPYIELTINALRHAGIGIERTPQGFSIQGRQRYGALNCSIEGDWSAAAFWLVAGAAGKSAIECKGVDTGRSLQGDKAIVDILRRMGATIRDTDYGIRAFPSALTGTEIDCRDIPDLVPALAVAAACAQGVTTFSGVSRLRLKESDRIATISSMLQSFGIRAESSQDTLTVTGGHPHACHTSSFGDHRIAMASAILAAQCGEPVRLDGADCVAKSYPMFFQDFNRLGGHIETL